MFVFPFSDSIRQNLCDFEFLIIVSIPLNVFLDVVPQKALWDVIGCVKYFEEGSKHRIICIAEMFSDESIYIFVVVLMSF